MEITPRINDDNTITAYVTSSYDGTKQQFVMRVRQGEMAYIRPGYFLEPDEQAWNAQAWRHSAVAKYDEKCVPIVHLKIDAAPEAPSPNRTSP
jgi:hypothetical protein